MNSAFEKRVFTNLTPLSPSPSKERGKRFIERGETPLLPTLPLPLLREGGQGDRLLINLFEKLVALDICISYNNALYFDTMS